MNITMIIGLAFAAALAISVGVTTCTAPTSSSTESFTIGGTTSSTTRIKGPFTDKTCTTTISGGVVETVCK